jgi:uncharacterized protein (TIGR00255 family)
MIASMTGFALVNREVPGGRLALELRSVNHRYLEFQCRLPDEVRTLEGTLREVIAAKLARGKVDCRVSFNTVATGTISAPDANALDSLVQTVAVVQKRFPDSRPLSVWEVLHAPGVMTERETPPDALREPLLAMLQEALADLDATRRREGEKLAAMIGDRLARIEEIVKLATPLVPAAVAAFQEKLSARLSEALQAPVDERIRQEVVLFASRIDIAEELNRLSAHVQEVRRVLKHGGAAGKRLDFLMQELNREANTLGSKSVASDLSKLAVELKVLIEQMREQIQNIE